MTGWNQLQKHSTRNRSFYRPSLGTALRSFAVEDGVWQQILWSFFIPQHTFLWLWGLPTFLSGRQFLKWHLQGISISLIHSGIPVDGCALFFMKIVFERLKIYLDYYYRTVRYKNVWKKYVGHVTNVMSCELEMNFDPTAMLFAW